MANHYRGEVTVGVSGRAYTLRPTFQILCEIEERIGLKLPQLLRRVAGKGLLASEILMLLAIVTLVIKTLVVWRTGYRTRK